MDSRLRSLRYRAGSSNIELDKSVGNLLMEHGNELYNNKSVNDDIQINGGKEVDGDTFNIDGKSLCDNNEQKQVNSEYSEVINGNKGITIEEKSEKRAKKKKKRRKLTERNRDVNLDGKYDSETDEECQEEKRKQREHKRRKKKLSENDREKHANESDKSKNRKKKKKSKSRFPSEELWLGQELYGDNARADFTGYTHDQRERYLSAQYDVFLAQNFPPKHQEQHLTQKHKNTQVPNDKIPLPQGEHKGLYEKKKNKTLKKKRLVNLKKTSSKVSIWSSELPITSSRLELDPTARTARSKCRPEDAGRLTGSEEQEFPEPLKLCKLVTKFPLLTFCKY